ncbi:MAG: hypothetical protein WA584_21480 [Pyrinomonadaceae bacterium]
MYKLIKALSLSILLSIAVFAQTTTDTAARNNLDNGDSNKPTADAKRIVVSPDYNKNEYYVGYSNQQVNEFSRSTFHGFEVGYVRNVHRFFGIRGTVSGAFRNERFNGSFVTGTTTTTFNVESKRRVYNFLGGVQIKDNASTSRFKPFGFAMGGVAVNTNHSFSTSCANCTTSSIVFFDSSDTGLAGSFGGGLDIKINNKIDFRAIQVDYNPIYSNTRVDNNFRFGIGIVIK